MRFLSEYRLWWTGAGFGTSNYIGNEFNNAVLFDSNSLFSVILWFGLLASPLYFLVQFLALRRPEDSFKYILLVSLCVSNMINAGGVWTQMFFISILIFKIKHNLVMSGNISPWSFSSKRKNQCNIVSRSKRWSA